MNTRKIFALAFGGMLLAGCLTGCGTWAASQSSIFPAITASAQTPDTSVPFAAAGAGWSDNDVSYEELFKPYEPFGLIYDTGKNELQYQGQTVRWFEDYYTIEDGTRAGNDFFNENGIVDVYAVRDFSSFVRSDDGSFDPGGKLVDVKPFSAAEFAARDIEAIKNPAPIVAISGDPLSEKELEGLAKEYEEFGVTYDVKNDQWYFNGEQVRFFQDVLTSNGEDLTSGKFKGAIRTFGSSDGTVDICTVRVFTNLDASGYGTLTGVEKYSQAEFDEHTQSALQSGSGFSLSAED